MAKILKTLKDFLLSPYYRYQKRKKLKEKLEQLRKQDPFIYK